MHGPYWNEHALASLDTPTPAPDVKQEYEGELLDTPTAGPLPAEQDWHRIVSLVAEKLPAVVGEELRRRWALELIEHLNRGGFSIVATCPPLPDRP